MYALKFFDLVNGNWTMGLDRYKSRYEAYVAIRTHYRNITVAVVDLENGQYTHSGVLV